MSLAVFLGNRGDKKQEGHLIVSEKICAQSFKTAKLGAKPCNAPMLSNLQFIRDGELFEDVENIEG